MKSILAVDMGATSIRGIVAKFENDALIVEEIMRFNHEIQSSDGRKHWDWQGLLDHIVQAILTVGDQVSSVAVDTWGVDFGLIDENGELLEEPTSYRDESCQRGFELAQERMSLYDLYQLSGNDVAPINSLFQLLVLREQRPEVYNRAKHFLMMPDLVNYFLTGKKSGEMTSCSTSQMFNLIDGTWNEKIIEQYDLKRDMFPPIVENTSYLGLTSEGLIPELRELDIPVMSIASHDTASAAYMTESYTDPSTLFLSCGTWAMIGCFTDAPIINEFTYENSLTNETGYMGRNMFMRNSPGLYLVEKLREYFEGHTGKKYTFAEITELVEQTRPNQVTIDINEPSLNWESHDFLADLEATLDNSGQARLEKKSDYFRALYESLVQEIGRMISLLSEQTGRDFENIHIIGGGSQSRLLCQMIADGTGLSVLAGPSEATALGNLSAQWAANLNADERKQLRSKILGSISLMRYESANDDVR